MNQIYDVFLFGISLQNCAIISRGEIETYFVYRKK